MAVVLNAGDVKRTDMYFVDPNQILMKEDLRGRRFPPTETEIIEMAISLKTHGQREPVECRKLPDKRLQLNLGFTRTAAARLLREGFTYEGETYHDPEFKLKVLIADSNDKEAFVHNIVENAHRKQTSPIDDAHNQRVLRDQHGMNDSEITKLYRYTDVNKVGRLRKLLNLNNAQQEMVHIGDLSVAAALELLELPEDKRTETLETLKSENGKVSGTAIRATVRDHHLNDENRLANEATTNTETQVDEDNKIAPPINPPALKTGAGGSGSSGGSNGTGGPNAKPKKKPLTVAEIRKFVEALREKHKENEKGKPFFVSLLAWMNGQRTDKTMEAAFDAFMYD